MEELIESLKENKEWRIRELTQLKTLLYSENQNDISNFNIISKYAIPTTCSIWEGFFKESLGDYYSFYNRNQGLEKDINILTNIIDHNKLINKTYQDFETKKKRLVKDIKDVFENPKFKEEYKPQIGLKKLSDTNKLLERMNLDSLNIKYKTKLNKMINLRNVIIHGERKNIVFSLNQIELFINLVIDLMSDLESIIISKSKEMCDT